MGTVTIPTRVVDLTYYGNSDFTAINAGALTLRIYGWQV